MEEAIKVVWSSTWVEEGTQCRLERKANNSGSFFLFSIKDSGG